MWRSVLEWLAVAALAAAAALGLGGCGESRAKAVAAADLPAPPPSAEVLELGRKVYNFRCYFCHGYSGDAKTLATTYLEPKPRDFSNTPVDALPRSLMLAVVKHGKGDTAMKGFAGILDDREIAAVTDFVRQEFMVKKVVNTRYHTVENGWPNHERNAVAFPFARGEIAVDTAWELLSESQQKGKRLFMSACVTCHDHGKVNDPGQVWESRPVTYPRDAYCTSCHQDVPRSAPSGAHPARPATHTFSEPDGSVPIRRPAAGESVASGYLVHDKAPVLHGPTPLESMGERLFQKNCAFCHAADGTSKGWIGSFLEPHPRDLTSPKEMRGMTKQRLVASISNGLPNTSMPAWKEVLEPAQIDALVAYINKAFYPVEGVGQR
ncbi:MAG: c-type cytochrome [Burkholderiales bacterium]|nr:c-type cytochrome [Burkholderiales bacterium]